MTPVSLRIVSESPLLFERADNGVAWLTLNRPHVLNAMNMAVRDEMWTALAAIRDDPEVRAVVIRGAGDRAFSAGADISEFGTAPSVVEARRARQERDVWGAMLACTKPLVAAIHDRSLDRFVEAYDRYFRCVDHWRRSDTAQSSQAGHRNRGAHELVARSLVRPRTL